ncbi:hypothetical protein, partial [Fusobacterium sp. PH5-44]|uniref:hypothetical protein n=1 Tax=Fusobacterium sp. PH5-44 TaxID=2940518 RepID=UPI003D1D82FF
KELDDDFNKMTKEDKLNKINSFNRSNLRDVWGRKRKSKKMNQYSVIYHNVVYSRKYLEVELRLNEIKKLDYNISSDFKLLNTIKIEYKEYDEKKLDNNEWDGE